MARKVFGSSLVAAGFAVLVWAAPAHAQATRTWVSGVGDDVNPCSRTAPCKTFAGAISKTLAGGVIDCLDPGGFGAVTITKSITIDCSATLGSVLVQGTNGINISGAGISVTLRGLDIEGTGSGLIGINFTAGASLTVENCFIQGFNAGTAAGLVFAPNSVNATLMVNNTTFVNNGVAPATGGGILIQPAAGGNAVAIIHSARIENNANGLSVTSTSGSVTMTVRDSTLSNNRGSGITTAAGNAINMMVDRATISSNFQNGIRSSGASSLVRVNNSVISGNATGVAVASGGAIHSYKNNAINGNGVDGTPITQEALN